MWSRAIFSRQGGSGTGEADTDGGCDACRGEFERRETDGTDDTGVSSKGKKLKRGTGRGWIGIL